MTPAGRAAWLLAVSALLAGCATSPPHSHTSIAATGPSQAEIDARRRAEFDHSMARWHGARVQELRAKLGAPSATWRQPDGKPVWVYERSGPSNFRCAVSYLLDGPDPRKARVSGHRIEGC